MGGRTCNTLDTVLEINKNTYDPHLNLPIAIGDKLLNTLFNYRACRRNVQPHFKTLKPKSKALNGGQKA